MYSVLKCSGILRRLIGKNKKDLLLTFIRRFVEIHLNDLVINSTELIKEELIEFLKNQ